MIYGFGTKQKKPVNLKLGITNLPTNKPYKGKKGSSVTSKYSKIDAMNESYVMKNKIYAMTSICLWVRVSS